MNTPCWEADGWTALVGGNPTERIGRSRVNDMAGGLGSRPGRSVVAVERCGRCRDINRQSQIRSILFKNKDDQFRTSAVERPNS